MKKTRTRIHEDMLIHREKIKTESNFLRVENTAEDLQASISCIESNKLEQESREGYNQIDESQLSNHINTEDISNGIITSTSFTNVGLVNISANTNAISIENGDYYISCDIRLKSGTCERINSLQILSNISLNSILKSVENISIPQISNKFQRYIRKYTFENVTTEKINRFLVQVADCENAIFEITNVQISRENKDYEKFGSMPSKDFPSTIEGVTGDLKLKVQNKNLAYLYNSSGYKSCMNGEWIGSNNYDSFIARVKPNATYYAQNIHSNLCYFDKDMNFLKGLSFVEARKFNTNDLDNVYYVTVAVSKEQRDKVMIEESSEPTDFVERKEKEFAISLGDKTLYKGDKILRQNGKWYFSRHWKEFNRNIVADDISRTEQGFYILPNILNNIKQPTKIYSTHQKEKTVIDTEWNTFDGNFIGQLYPNIAKNIYISYKAETKTEIIEWYNALNNKFIYELKNEELELVEGENLLKQLDKILLNLYEYDTVTNFDFDKDVTFEIEVEKDNIRLLNSRLDEIEKQNVNTQALSLEMEV